MDIIFVLLSIPITSNSCSQECDPIRFVAVYTREVWSRLPELLAASTSVFGEVLKIDSIKKVCKKLQGAAANTASWATNVGNEKGEIVISVLTESESSDSLAMAEGLMDRYKKAGKHPLLLLYTDRDCCCHPSINR